jgi:hypothetical protein
VHYTSGDVLGCRFVAPVSQSSAALTVYAYCTAVTGSPTDVRCVLRNGATGAEDADRPEQTDTALATSSAVDCSSAAASWVTFSLTASLTAGQTYWLLLDNRTGTPASHYPTFQTRSLLGHSVLGHARICCGGYSTAGMSSDPTLENFPPAMVVKFSDGSLMGGPYVVVTTHSNNANSRGIAFTPTEDIVVSGLVFYAAGSQISGGKLRVNGGSDVVTATGDRGALVSGSYSVVRFAPTTLSGGTRYDALLTFGSTSTVLSKHGMGTSPPTDVQNCRFAGGGYVDDTATDDQAAAAVMLIIDDNPAISGGGGLLTHPGLAGGLRG